MFGNYDDHGSSFGGNALTATSSDGSVLSSFAALDPGTGHLKVMLVNQDPQKVVPAVVDTTGFSAAAGGTLYRYSSAQPTAIASEGISASGGSVLVSLPPYSITMLDLPPAT
jgi:hypothetical protein